MPAEQATADTDERSNNNYYNTEEWYEDIQNDFLKANDDQVAPQRRYSVRLMKAPELFYTMRHTYDEDEPTKSEALKGQDKRSWCSAMSDELSALQTLKR